MHDNFQYLNNIAATTPSGLEFINKSNRLRNNHVYSLTVY